MLPKVAPPLRCIGVARTKTAYVVAQWRLCRSSTRYSIVRVAEREWLGAEHLQVANYRAAADQHPVATIPIRRFWIAYDEDPVKARRACCMLHTLLYNRPFAADNAFRPTG